MLFQTFIWPDHPSAFDPLHPKCLVLLKLIYLIFHRLYQKYPCVRQHIVHFRIIWMSHICKHSPIDKEWPRPALTNTIHTSLCVVPVGPCFARHWPWTCCLLGRNPGRVLGVCSRYFCLPWTLSYIKHQNYILRLSWYKEKYKLG